MSEVKRYDMRVSLGGVESYESPCGDYVDYEDYAALEAKCAAMAAENAMLKKRIEQIIQIINNADNDCCMCGSAMKDHVHSGCGHPTGTFDYHYNQWLDSDNKTPVTDAFLAEVRAQGGAKALEDFAEFNIKSIDPFDDEYTEVLKETARAARCFAAQLRKGGEQK